MMVMSLGDRLIHDLVAASGRLRGKPLKDEQASPTQILWHDQPTLVIAQLSHHGVWGPKRFGHRHARQIEGVALRVGVATLE
ncbi:hypothetical protein N599_11250 [Saccharopolyspora erythraea D]|nr:hypothetical protein N599_11250 [Saccharopolyspora erythraea D]